MMGRIAAVFVLAVFGLKMAESAPSTQGALMGRVKKNEKEKKENTSNRYKAKRLLFKYDENALKKTLSDIKDHGMGIRAACRLNGVPRSTIQDRLHGRILEKERKIGPDPILGIEGEKKISKWVIDMAKCGFPIRKRDLLETVAEIVKESKKPTPFKDGRPGEKWYRSFLRRHEEISVREAESINRARAVVTEQMVRNWFTDLKDFLYQQGCIDILDEPDRIFNGDETGFSLCPKTGKVLAPRGYKNVYEIKNSKEKENITVYVSFNASGKICPPFVVLPYLRPPKAVINNMPKSWVIGRSDTGWMKGSIFYEYMANEFNDWLGSNGIKKPCLVFVDGHRSHMTLALSEFCDANQIILYALPPNTTHMMQPADVSVFKPLKQQWKKTVLDWQKNKGNLNNTITKVNFCKVFADTMTMDMTTAIINGFRKCGLYPFNPDAVDYSKCVKDTLSKLKRKSKDSVTAKDFDAAIKVFSLMKGEFRDIGIDTDLILEKIESARCNASPKRRSRSLPSANATPGTPAPKDPSSSQNISLPDVGSFISLDDISIVPLSDMSMFSPLNNLLHSEKFDDSTTQSRHTMSGATCNTVVTVAEIHEPESTAEITELESVAIPNTRKYTQNQEDFNIIAIYDDISTTDDAIIPNDHCNNFENNLVHQEELPITENVSHTLSKSTIRSPLVEMQITMDPFDKHLKYPEVNTETKNKRSETQTFPMAISSEKWRDRILLKEEEKLKKTREIENRRKIRANLKAEREAKLREKRALRRKRIVRRKAKSKPKQKCSTCEEVLISDIEDESEKNIGCDNCIRWYHLRCTNLSSLPYSEASKEDYICNYCT